jgi:Cytochrome b(N-terminal)/b6/petB
MQAAALTGHAPVAIDLNQPGSYLNWNLFTISVANLVLIAVMVAIFGAALVLPFPRAHGGEEPAADPDAAEPVPDAGTEPGTEPGDERMWTARARRRALTSLPPGKLLPDRQPAYVASWVYVFGVGSLAAFGVVIVSGFAIALGGSDWWHTNPVGHFFNSLHLWSVELFMALLVIHLWGKFWMAAWRGRRALTWMTGVVAFVVSVVECFTGYLSQQNFDSQWIATNGKDAFNAAGVGAFFNLMNFGQMLMWHIVLIPILLIALIGAHVLLVRMRGVSHPLPVTRPRGVTARMAARRADRAAWRGPTRRYDILKEGTIASSIVLVLVVALASLLSSPDIPSVTVKSWVQVDPGGFLATAATELNQTSGSATLGPPYNNNGTPQRVLVAPASWAGVRQPINTAQTFVLGPLAGTAPTDPALAAALATYQAASADQQNKWAASYGNVVTKVKFVNGSPVVPAANDGPVPVLLATELTLARSGAIDTDLLAQRQFYGTDFTKPLLFLADGDYYNNLAAAQHLTGDQWGVMNETGSYPGQPWLWLFQMWYHMQPGWGNSDNVDLIAIFMTGLATLLLLFVPFIPGLRDIPGWIPVHRLIWRDWNRRSPGPVDQPGAKPEPAGQKLQGRPGPFGLAMPNGPGRLPRTARCHASFTYRV